MIKDGYKEVRIGPKKYHIPKEWEFRNFGLISKYIKAGGTPKADKKEYYGGEILFVKIEDMTKNGKYIYNTKSTITEDGLKNSSAWIVPKKSLLLSMYGSYGKVSINKVELATNQAILGIIPSEEVNLDYLYYFSLGCLKPYFKSLVKATTQANLTKQIVNNTPVLSPPLPEQKKIAAILSTVDKAIEKTDEIIEKSKELKKGLMQQLLTKGIGHSEFKEVRIGTKKIKIPVVWTLIKFGEVFKKRNEKANVEKEYKYVGLEHLGTGEINLLGYDRNGNNKSSKRLFKSGDILYGKLRPYLKKAAITDFDGICSTDIIPIYATKKSVNNYLIYLVHSKMFVDFAVSTMEGTNLPRTSWRVIKNLIIPLPPLQEQKKIASILSSVDEKIQKEQEYREKLEELKKGLMQKLLTGEVRVKVEDEEV
ncbi:restriction modification system DNA specificity domain protein [Halothermothrix orenii H 168]|uniref:Restriction modification system DNA specificity domain protein n=2 Tax=Halothermothrix orenii TaxID=31909 RepID=B8D1X6_HALOH|nr:restriction modification system DNA specificity domain protein [Halothermothrix orenii H 168]